MSIKNTKPYNQIINLNIYPLIILSILNIHGLLKRRRELFAAKTSHGYLASVLRGETGSEFGQRIVVPAADRTHIKSYFSPFINML